MKKKVLLPNSESRPRILNVMEKMQFQIEEREDALLIEDIGGDYLMLTEIMPKGFRCKPFKYPSLQIERDRLLLSEGLINKSLAGIKDEKSGNKDFFDYVSTIIIGTQDEELYKIMAEIIAPEYQKRFPNGSIYILTISDLLFYRQGLARLLMAEQKLPDLLETASESDFPGFASMRSLQSPAISQTLKPYLSNMFLMFEPVSYGIYSDKLNGYFLFLFGEQYVHREPNPPTFVAHYLSRDFMVLQKGRPNNKDNSYRDVKFSDDQFSEFVKEYVYRLNLLFKHLYNPTNFITANGELDALKAFNAQSTFHLIAAETSLIFTHYLSPQVRMASVFAVLDKIANLIRMLHPNPALEVEIFKRLISEKETSKLYGLFDLYPKPFNNLFRNKLRDLFSKLASEVKQSIFIKDRIQGENIVIKQNNTQEKIHFDIYIQDVIRALRNTHHGYGIKDSNLSRLLISDCSVGDSLEYIVPLLVLLLVADCEKFIGIGSVEI